MGSTKILVFRLKEIIYTALFVALGVLFIILLIFMFTSKKDKMIPTIEYIPGAYTSSVMLDNQPVNVEVIVDKKHIQSVRLVQLDATTEKLYPLLQEAMSNIEGQLIADSTVNALELKSEHKYTSTLLIDAINDALAKATVETIHKE